MTGRLVSPAEPLLEELGLRDRVEFLGRYAQREAPAIMRRAHLLLHTKVKDPCPSVVIEAMACGLPVVYPASGGTVELVGDEAGIGVPHPDGWERDEPPSPEALADAVAAGARRPRALRAAARGGAPSSGSRSSPWLDRHAELFDQLLRSLSSGSRALGRAASRGGSAPAPVAPRERDAARRRAGARASGRPSRAG